MNCFLILTVPRTLSLHTYIYILLPHRLILLGHGLPIPAPAFLFLFDLSIRPTGAVALTRVPEQIAPLEVLVWVNDGLELVGSQVAVIFRALDLVRVGMFEDSSFIRDVQ
jgi:hypothetical protein